MLRARAAILAAAMIGCSVDGAPQETEHRPVDVDARPREPATNGPSTAPQGSFGGKSDACGDLFAYRASDDGTQIFGVSLEHTGDDRVIDLGTNPEGVLVTVDVFAEPATTFACDVLASPSGAKTTWVAEAGRLALSAVGNDVRVTLDDVHLVGPEKGFAVVVPHVEIGAHR